MQNSLNDFFDNYISLSRTHTPLEKEISTGKYSYMLSWNEKLVVFEPGHLSCWSAVWWPAGNCNISSLLHCHVCRMLDEVPVHVWNKTCMSYLSIHMFYV